MGGGDQYGPVLLLQVSGMYVNVSNTWVSSEF